MIISDILSRRPDHTLGIEDDNKDITLLPDELFVEGICLPNHLFANAIDFQLQQELAKALQTDTTATHMTSLMQDPATKRDLSYWTLTSDPMTLLLHNHKVY